ncbi:MAG: YfiR family protein [Candidatus Latescibacterota bacterium]
MGGAEPPRAPEHEVKAAFLVHLPDFVQWPAAALPDSATALTIGILGDDPFGHVLTELAARTRQGRRLEIRRSARLQELPVCHILYISRSETRYLPQILAHLRGGSVLTVGDSEGFARAGGMVNFVRQGQKVRFEINATAAERAQLHLSAKLLRLAILVGEEGSP